MEAFGADDYGARFLLKPHPNMNLRTWNSIARGFLLPSYMNCVTGSMDTWLEQSSCVIIGTSTAAIEIALSGLPLIQVGRESDFGINALHWFPEFSGPVYTAHELKAAVLKVLSAPDAEKRAAAALATRLAKRCISAISDKTIESFLKLPRSNSGSPHVGNANRQPHTSPSHPT